MSGLRSQRMVRAILPPCVGFCATVLMVGCGRGHGYVSGKVTMDGKPVTDTVIYFLPERGPLAQAPLDAEGRYRLTTPGQGPGAALGRYRVYLAPLPSEEEELAKAHLKESDFAAGKALPRPPATQIPPRASKYYSAATTDWVREVTSGSNEFDFELTKE
jgi:hypothetical protein